jgi:hypothetical protein
MAKRPGYDVKLPVYPNQFKTMLEAFFGIVVPVLKDILWAACGAMLAYAMNKLNEYFV